MLVMYAMVFLVPGDPASLALGPRATPALKQALMERMGLDQPIYVQIWNFFRNAATGDLGYERLVEAAGRRHDPRGVSPYALPRAVAIGGALIFGIGSDASPWCGGTR